jgi:hypothetical protein
MIMKRIIFAALAVALGVGCASSPVPADKLARSQASVRSAEEQGAQADPRAAIHLKLAKEQLAEAKKLMKDGDNEAAKNVLLRAEADGDAALNIARATAAEADATRTIQAIQQAKVQLSTEGPKS